MNRFFYLVNWEIASYAGTILSVMIAGWALYSSSQQFNKSIEKTDQQILIMKEERRRGQEENRPYIVIDSVALESDPQRYPGDTTRYWDYSLHLKNLGIRPATELTVYNQVLGRIKNTNDSGESDTYKNYRISTADTTEFGNPLMRDRTEKILVFPRYRNFDRYLVKVTVKYKDPILDTTFVESYAYSNTRFDVLGDGSEIFWDGMSGLRKKEKKITDSLIGHFFSQKPTNKKSNTINNRS